MKTWLDKEKVFGLLGVVNYEKINIWWGGVEGLLIGRKAMANLDSVLKSRDITLLSKIWIVKAMVSSVVMYGCKSWTIKKGECRRIDAFELWCWRRLLRVPWTARRCNQSILKEISPEYSLEDWYWSWNSNTLATWCEEQTHWKRPWCWERLKAEGEGDDRGWDGWMASLTRWTWVWVNSGSWWWTGRPAVPQSMGLQRVGYHSATELVNKTAFRILIFWAGTEMRVCFRILDDSLLSSMISVISNVEWYDSF